MTDEEQMILELMDDLINELDGLQMDSAMRQMFLETQWLRQNLKDGKFFVPTSWQPMVYKPSNEIKRHANVAYSANRLGAALKRYAARNWSNPDSNTK